MGHGLLLSQTRSLLDRVWQPRQAGLLIDKIRAHSLNTSLPWQCFCPQTQCTSASGSSLLTQSRWGSSASVPRQGEAAVHLYLHKVRRQCICIYTRWGTSASVPTQGEAAVHSVWNTSMPTQSMGSSAASVSTQGAVLSPRFGPSPDCLTPAICCYPTWHVYLPASCCLCMFFYMFCVDTSKVRIEGVLIFSVYKQPTVVGTLTQVNTSNTVYNCTCTTLACSQQIIFKWMPAMLDTPALSCLLTIGLMRGGTHHSHVKPCSQLISYTGLVLPNLISADPMWWPDAGRDRSF